MADEDDQLRYVKLSKDQTPVEINPGELNQPIDVPQLNVRTCDACAQPLPENFEPPAVEPWTTGIFHCGEDPESCYTGLFCPCVLFGRNYENVRDDYTSATTPCVLHAIFVEGGLAVAATLATLNGIDPTVSYYICEGLIFSWWMCGVYTGIVRLMLQKKYHLEDNKEDGVVESTPSKGDIFDELDALNQNDEIEDTPCDPCMVHCCLHWCALCQEHREMKNRLSDNFVMPMTLVNAPPVQQMNSGQDNQNSSSSANNHAHHTNLEMQPL